MSDEAIENLAQGSAEVTSMVNSLIAQGYSKEAATSYATQVFKGQRYSNLIMNGNDMSAKMSYINSMNKGYNYYNPEDWNNIIGEAVNVDQLIASWTPGYTSTMGGLITNTIGSATGVDYARMYGALGLNQKGLSGSQIALMSEADLKKYAEEVTNDFANDKNQTNETLQNITVENLMNELSVIDEWLGNWAKV